MTFRAPKLLVSNCLLPWPLRPDDAQTKGLDDAYTKKW
jgi:hypothetical protein